MHVMLLGERYRTIAKPMLTKPIRVTSSVAVWGVCFLLLLTLLPRLANRWRINAGFTAMNRGVGQLTDRAFFETVLVGVPHYNENTALSSIAKNHLDGSLRLFLEVLQSENDQREAARGLLRAAALAGITPSEELRAIGSRHGLTWETAVLQLNSDPEVAVTGLRDICVETSTCRQTAIDLDNVARHAEAIELLRGLVARSGLPPGELEIYYSQALAFMPHPGRTHGEIVRNCAVFFARGEKPISSMTIRSTLADIYALCAEGLIVDPYAAEGTSLESALTYAQAAIEVGGLSRYRLMVAGWAALNVGEVESAGEFLRAALASSGAGYQREGSDAEIIALIESMLAVVEDRARR